MSIPDSELVGNASGSLTRGKEEPVDGPKLSLFRGAPRDILAVGAVGLALAVGFGLGDVTGKAGAEKGSEAPQTAQIEDLEASAATAVTEAKKPSSSYTKPAKAPKPQVGHPSGTYVASKNGTKFYLPECSGAKRIKEENKIWFYTKEEAMAAGFGPAANCKGL